MTKQTAGHVAAWITHESLLDYDFDGFSDWHARIDEPPNTITTGSIKSGMSSTAFKNRFELEQVDDSEWAKLVPKQSDNWKEASEDTLWSSLTDFLKLASRKDGIFVKATCWRDFGSGEPIEWLSYWSPSSLEIFRTAQIAGSSYLSSLGYLANKTLANQPKIDELALSNSRAGQPTVKIRYFTKGHTGSTEYWATSSGRHCMKKISDWLGEHAPRLGFWSGNKIVTDLLEHRISGKLVSPKLAGLNQYRDLESCAIFYSAKAQPNDNPLYDIFGLNKTEVKNAREGEDIFQFVFRGALREASYAGTYTIYLYSEDQANELDVKLQAHGCFNTSIEPVDEAGIMDIERPNRSRQKTLSPSQLVKKEEKERELSRLRVAKHRAKKKAEATINHDK